MTTIRLVQILITWLFGGIVLNDGAPTNMQEAELSNMVRNAFLSNKASKRSQPRFPSIQLPPHPLGKDPHFGAQHQQPDNDQHICAERKIKSGRTELFNRLEELLRPTPPASPPILPDLKPPPFPAFPKPPSDVSVVIVGDSISKIFSIAVPPMFNIMDLLVRIATEFQTETQPTHLPVTLKDPIGTCQEIQKLGPLTSLDVITIEIKDAQDRVLWRSECLPSENLYILPGYTILLEEGSSRDININNQSSSSFGR